MLITLVIGLPASGKTTFAKTLDYSYFLDDPDLDKIRALPDDPGYHLVITDPAFCDEFNLASAMKYLTARYIDVEFVCVYFANDPEQCLKNAQKRPEKIVKEHVKQLAKLYNPPDSAIPVWRDDVHVGSS